MRGFKKKKNFRDHGLKPVKYKRDVSSENKKRFISSGYYRDYKLLTIQVYEIKTFIAEIKKSKSLRYNSHKIESKILFMKEFTLVGSYSNSSLTMYCSLTLFEAEYLVKQFVKYSKQLGKISLYIGCFDERKYNREIQYLNMNNILYSINLKNLTIYSCIEFDSLTYLKNSWLFANIKIYQSSFIYFKNMPKFIKFTHLTSLELNNIKFENISLEYKFFESCQCSENLTTFTIEEKASNGEAHDQTCAFHGYLKGNKYYKPKICFFFGIFSSNQLCEITFNRQIVTDKSKAKYLLHNFRRLDIEYSKMSLEYLNPCSALFNCYLQLRP